MNLKFLPALFLLAWNAHALVPSIDKMEWKSVITDTEKDCIVISSATEEAPIDFYEAECKSFGGFQLFISGGDLRYGPVLKFQSKKIELDRPMSFHDLGSSQIEWIYKIRTDAEGVGKMNWKGLIYRLSVIDAEVGNDRSELYAVRLNGAKSCLLGKTDSIEKARELIYDSTARCH